MSDGRYRSDNHGHLLENLNQPQREAVMHGEGPLLVLAGPGSGKTTVIVKRIQYLIYEMRIPPEQILVITFTRDAARSMQQRFLQQSGQYPPSGELPLQRQSEQYLPTQSLPVNFGTFHSVFYHILLKSSYSDSNQQKKIMLLTEPQKKNLILPILKDIKQKTGGNTYTPDNMASDAWEMLTAISYYKNTGNEEGAVKKLSVEWKPHFGQVASAYRQSTVKQCSLDFDDMVFECKRILEQDEELRKFWQGHFSHILIDEFQDINPVQYSVVKLLAREPYNLFAVGDDDQAIYGFRGSSPACLKQFEEEFQARKVVLNLNYRSVPEIVEVSGKVIVENADRYHKELRAVQEQAIQERAIQEQAVRGSGENAVKIISFPEREEENAYLRAQIRKFQDGDSGKSHAVLFRTNTYMQSFAAGLEKEGIAYTMREKARNPYEHFVVKDVMAYLQLAAGKRQRALFLQIMNKPSRFLGREALADMEEIDFDRLRRWYGARKDAHRLEHMDSIVRFQTQLKAMERMPLHLAVSYVCKAVGYEEWLKKQAGAAGGGSDSDRRQEWLEILHWLKEDSRGYERVEDWLEAQENFGRMQEKGVGTEEDGAPENQKNAVQLMTVHAAKGLEFDAVWMPDCNEKIFPHGSMLDDEGVAEERRIFYVGMTRAKKSLELLWVTGTKERPRLMSRFLNPIAKDVLAEDYSSSSMSSSNSQLSRYSSKASATFSYSSSSSM